MSEEEVGYIEKENLCPVIQETVVREYKEILLFDKNNRKVSVKRINNFFNLLENFVKTCLDDGEGIQPPREGMVI